jgi:hypothetical protein
MKKLLVFLVSAFLALSLASVLAAQFTPQDIAQRDVWESFLKTADIVRFEKAEEGVTHPFKLYLKKGEVEAKAFWKNVDEELSEGALDSWRSEIAAYRLDKLLGLGMVPVVVERVFQGKPGSLSLYAANKYSLLKIMDENIPTPPEAADRMNKMKYLTRAFDCLIANDDRTQQNILYTEDWRTILIDHSRAFRFDKDHAERLIYGRNGFKTAAGKSMLFRQLPRSFVQAVRNLELEKVRAAVGPYLTEAQIKALMSRKVVLLAEIDDLIKENGEANVLF